MSGSPVQIANEKVTIAYALRKLGVYVPDLDNYQSWKARCPFGEFYHSDGGLSKALRVYPESNSAWCFAGCGYFSPVTAYSKAKDISSQEAALELLTLVGYRPLSLSEQWLAAAHPQEEEPDRDALAKALRIFCESLRERDWTMLQYDSLVTGMLDRCLSLLSSVRTDQEARQWFSVAKAAMSRVLEVPVAA